MDEQQKSLRLIHRTILTITTVILLFAISPNPTGIYTDALKELTELRDIDFKDYARYAIDEANKNRKIIHNIVRNQIGYAKGRLSNDFLFTEAVFMWWPTEVDQLSNYLYFFESKNTVSFLTFEMQQSPGDIYRKLRQESKTVPMARHDLSDYTLRWILVTPKEENAKVVLRAASPPGNIISRDEQVVYKLATGQPVPKEAIFTYEFNKGGHSIFLRQEDQATNSMENDYYALKWIKTTKSNNLIITDSSNRETIFQSMRKLWPQLESKTPREAASFLQSMALSKKNSVSFLGADVDPSIVILVGPAVLLSLLTFFYSHVAYFESGLKKRETTFDVFWAPLFPGTLPKIISFSSVILLPTGSIIMIWIRNSTSFLWEEHVYYGISVMFILVSGLLSVYKIVKCNRVIWERSE